tara:strand:- start:5857 stop:7116 length:1260 start_codon:yes stop_codon:yes gene_type:complete
MPSLLLSNLIQSKQLINVCKICIENRMFKTANTIINSIVYNILNISTLPKELISIATKNKNSYIIFVESNGHGHVTQMKNIILNLKHKYKCVGIVIGREKKIATEFAKNNQIPILNLYEPKYVSNKSTDILVHETILCLLNYSTYFYKKVSDFVTSKRPEFIINLHLPIKLICGLAINVFNISTQNRINFDDYYDKIVSQKKYSKFNINSVIFSCYMVDNFNLNPHKIAIDCVNNKHIKTIPPLIKRESLIEPIHRKHDTINEKFIICYFNVPQNIYLYNLIGNFKNIKFYVFIEKKPDFVVSSNIEFKELGKDFSILRKKSIGLITSCGVETIYENFQLCLPMLCIPSNVEQLFNAYDHSEKVPGFKWTFKITKNDINWLINFKYSKDYWEKHNNFTKFLNKDDLLEKYIHEKLSKNL